jgi:gamma-glutamyl-gamma-aminobutyrate hydrolase PuuD
MKLYSAIYGTGHGGRYPFEECDLESVGTPDQLTKNGGVLVIWGGEDIHPSIYGQPNVASFVWGTAPSKRDRIEISLMEKAMELGMPILGVCRGAQLACAMSGGKLAQDVDRHGTDHMVITSDGRELETSSVHHQMMYPFDVEHELLAWTPKCLSGVYRGLTEEEIANVLAMGEPEIVWFPKTKMLAVQGHPEFMEQDCEFNNYCRELLHAYCKN